jgi:hypothetical protein
LYAAPRTQQIIYLEQLNKYEAQQGNDQCVKDSHLDAALLVY